MVCSEYKLLIPGAAFIIVATLATTILTAEEPRVLGRARGMFTIGKCIYENSLTDKKAFGSDWHVQQKARNGRKPSVTVQKDGLHVFATGGTTIWLKKKLRNPLVITYTVRMDMDKMDREGLALQKEKGKAPSKYVVPSDVNCFWLADFPGDPQSVFNDKLFTGGFGTYHKMNGYYASTGGRANTTTRARRYPRRDRNNNDIAHPLWLSRDGKPGCVILPEKTQRIQLVACDGFVQYILDGAVVYEYAYGDAIKTTVDNGRTLQDDVYTREKYPAYTEGYFGLRLVRSAHVYSDVKVYTLTPHSK